MDYTFCYYKGRYVYDTKEYLSAYRANFFNIVYDPKKIKQMLEEIEKLVDFNKPIDLFALSNLLFDAKDKYSYSRAFSILDMLVSWNYAPAKYLLGQMYFYGAGVTTDLNKFYKLSQEAAAENYIPAKNALALAHFNGYGCKVDYNKSHILLEECENAKYGMALFNLGIGYMNGSYGYKKDLNKAFNYFYLASGQFHAKATYNLALMYLNGNGCTKNIDKAIDEYKNAAYLGHVKSQVKAGDIFYFGELTKKNTELAYEFYLMAAENGDAYAMYSVGYMNVKKEKLWADRYVGIDWLRKAASLGYEDAKKLLKNV